MPSNASVPSTGITYPGAPFDDQAGEAVTLLDVAHRVAGSLKRSIDGRNELIDCLGGQSEEVEITGLTLDIASDDQRATAGESEVACLIQAGDDLRNPLLQRTQHVRGGGDGPASRPMLLARAPVALAHRRCR